MRRKTLLKKYGDWIVGIFSVIFAILLFTCSLNIKQFDSSDVGAGFMPKVTAVLLLFLGLILIVRKILDFKKEELDESSQEPCCYSAVLLTFGLIFAYAVLIGFLGFLLTSSLYLFFQILVLSPKGKINYIKLLLIAVLVPAPIYMLFKNMFQVMLPSGILG